LYHTVPKPGRSPTIKVSWGDAKAVCVSAVADVLEKLGVAENVYSGFTVQQYPVLVDLKFSIGLAPWFVRK
jgi:hypothetical protein